MILGADRLFTVRIEDHNIGIGSYGYCAFLRKESKDLGSSGGSKLDESIQADTFLNHTAIVNQAHPVLDAGTTIRNLAEVIPAQFFLFLEAERTVVGGNHLKVIATKPFP